MHAKCAECGGKIDGDDIICANCLAQIINKLYFNNQGISKKSRLKSHRTEHELSCKDIRQLPA